MHCPGETAELLWQEMSDDEGTYQAHDIVYDKHSSKGSSCPRVACSEFRVQCGDHIHININLTLGESEQI